MSKDPVSGVVHDYALLLCPWRIWAKLVEDQVCPSPTSKVFVDIFWFSFIRLRYVLKIYLKQSVICLKS